MKEGIVQTDRRSRHDALEELREELTEDREEEEIPQIIAALSTLEKEAFRISTSRTASARTCVRWTR